MTTLTLPIQLGKKYVRRDGQVVMAERTHDSDVVQVGSAVENVWRDVGTVYRGTSQGLQQDCDLVTDYIEFTGHVHAALMAQYAEDAATNSEPWKLWEYKSPQSRLWTEAQTQLSWSEGRQYRRKPRTININGIDVPEPLRVAPENGVMVWMVVVSMETSVTSYRYYSSDPCFTRCIIRGVLHLTEQAARTHAEALLSFTKVAV